MEYTVSEGKTLHVVRPDNNRPVVYREGEVVEVADDDLGASLIADRVLTLNEQQPAAKRDTKAEGKDKAEAKTKPEDAPSGPVEF